MDETTREASRMLGAEDFDPFVGREAQFGDTGVDLVLDAVERSHDAPLPGLRAPFSLIFSGPTGQSGLAEGPYLCRFGADAAFAIYVVPIHTPAADRQNYQAVFN